ncbi:MAG: phosphodiesterase, partial [Verrucomicrobia bacterium]|nr:phosphodiesterase [Verrucomicrobiota bacterium]
QTPVAWSSFATGTNPGGHGIFDFISRDPKTYLPDLALNRYEQKSAFLPPRAVNRRRGTTVWELLSQAGIASVVLRCPCTYPPDNIRGRMLAGMGVPDLRGGLGTATFYSTADHLTAQESEQVVQVRPGGDGMIKTHLIGPRDPATRADFTLEISLESDPAAKRLTVRSAGKPQALEVREGQWSDWLRVRFKTGLLQSVAGMVRFHLVRLEPVLELYASPINFDPDAPLFPISSPPEYARELAAKTGAFYTTGMVEDHGGLNNERFDEAAYLDHCAGVMRERQRMMLYELERMTNGFFYCLFDTPDRLQHMFWRFGEPEHPANHGELTEDLRRVIEQHYRECDAVVGGAMRFADDRTLFIALSDHGMSSFQRGVHLNTWLHDNGLLAIQDGLRPGPDAGDMLRHVDWSRTKAYALGLGSIYLNLRGRESQGIVEVSEAPALQAAIAKGLAGLQDTQRAAVAIRSVVTREQVYRGPFAAESPDLMVNFSSGWRVSWSTALGGVPAGWFEDNVKRWSGDHIIDPVLTPGVLAMNRPFRCEGARMEDLAPTILAALGVPRGPVMEGESLLT